MTSGINTREMILEILLQINEEENTSHIANRNALSNISSFQSRNVPLLQESVRGLWNTGS